jgi:hypothetical protein
LWVHLSAADGHPVAEQHERIATALLRPDEVAGAAAIGEHLAWASTLDFGLLDSDSRGA